MFWAFGFILLLSSFVQIFFTGDIAGTTLPRQVKELITLGKTTTLSGGLMAGIIAIPMQRLFGVSAAKITITILTVVFFMFLTDTTPYDIYVKLRDKAVEEKEELARQMEESRAARAEKQRQKERERLAAQ